MFRAVLAAALLTAAPALAQPPAGGSPEMHAVVAHMRQVCATDIQTYCASVPEGDRDARRQCMSTNQPKFSKDCRDALDQLHAWRQSHPEASNGG